jgi:hypothetical protein
MAFFKKREGKAHHAGKIRLGALFQSQMGYDAFFEVPSIEAVDFNEDIITYYFDVLLGIKGYKNYEYRGFIIAEVDGRIGHRTIRTDSKAYRRDNHFLSKYGIPTARFATEDLTGSKKLTDDEIIQELEYQVKGFEDSYKPYYCFSCKTFGQSKGFCNNCRLGGFPMKMRGVVSAPHMAPPAFGGNKSAPTKSIYQRRTIPIPPHRKFDTCTHCNHGFHKHTFGGCSQCDRCITGIIHSSDKKDT